MVDLKRLKATADLAKLNHDSYKTEESKAAHTAAVNAYETAVLDQATDEVVDAIVTEVNKVGSTAPAKPAVSSKQAPKPAPEGSTAKGKPVADQTDVKKADAVADKAAADAIDATTPDPTAETDGASGNGQADAGTDELAEKKSE